MKKIFALVLTILMVFGLVACGEKAPAAPEAAPVVAPAETQKTEEKVETSAAAVEEKVAFPEKPLRFVVSYGAGGYLDNAVRPIATIAEKALGQSIVVENVTGGSGSIGFQAGLKEAADGYTLIGSCESATVFDAYDDMPDINYEDTKVIMATSEAKMFVYVKGDSPYQSIQDLFDAEKANPGSVLKGTTGSIGVSANLEALWKTVADVSFTAYVSDTGASAITSVLGGFCDFGIGTAGAISGYIESGELRALCVCDTERSPYLPDVPALTDVYPEMGEYLPLTNIFMISVAKDTPDEVCDILTAAFEEAYNSKEYQDTLASICYEPLGLTGEAAQKFVEDYRFICLSVLTKAGIIDKTMQELGY